jgi:hypothetical protein
MIKKIGDGTQDLLMLREEFIPVVKLHKLFGLKKSFEKLEDGMLIVVKSGNTKVALSIDEFLNQHQVVVKPLDKNFRSVQGIGAATVRGDGSIGLILDVLGIIDAQIKIENDITLTSSQKYHLKQLVSQRAYELKERHKFEDTFMSKVFARFYKKLKKQFVVSSYMEIPKSKFDEACSIINNVTFGDLI